MSKKIKEIVETEDDTIEFEAVVKPTRSGGGSVRMNTAGLKKIIDSVNKKLEEFKTSHNGNCPGLSLPKLNQLLGLDRKSAAGVQETLNQRAFRYLKATNLWFSASRKSEMVWIDRVNPAVFDRNAEYAKKSVLDEEGNTVLHTTEPAVSAE